VSRYPISIPPGTAILRIERIDDSWLLWIHANPEFTLGTYIQLYDSGRITRCTERPNEVDEQLIKGEDTK